MNKRSVMEYLKSYFDEDAQGRRTSKGRHQLANVTDVAPYCFLFSSPAPQRRWNRLHQSHQLHDDIHNLLTHVDGIALSVPYHPIEGVTHHEDGQFGGSMREFLYLHGLDRLGICNTEEHIVRQLIIVSPPETVIFLLRGEE